MFSEEIGNFISFTISKCDNEGCIFAITFDNYHNAFILFRFEGHNEVYGEILSRS